MNNTEDATFNALKYPMTEDEIAFGRNVWVYCNEHCRAHITGWCSVSPMAKFPLKAATVADAEAEARDMFLRPSTRHQ